ncbi:hypothetical protein LMG33818_000035 [Halomonadaceae bacterium LMG 33818]|uniref:DUF2158 domain-containing protein n=1 Tax=Cernens ardua TaxID=3402176 RepID=UPI003EDBFDD9
MAKDIFSKGDIVKLKSGGPEMTVKKPMEDMQGDPITYRCQWFAGKKLEVGDFPPESLIYAEVAEKK